MSSSFRGGGGNNKIDVNIGSLKKGGGEILVEAIRYDEIVQSKDLDYDNLGPI